MQEIGDLQINEDIAFQEKEWTAQRVGWAAMILIVLLAAAGLFGHGPISWTSAATDDGDLEVSFERFGRRGGSQAVTITAAASAATSSSWEIDVSRDYTGAVQINSVTPQPDSVETIQGALRYTFPQAEPGADLEVTLSITPDTLWGASGDIRLAGGEPVTVRQFFFP